MYIHKRERHDIEDEGEENESIFRDRISQRELRWRDYPWGCRAQEERGRKYIR